MSPLQFILPGWHVCRAKLAGNIFIELRSFVLSGPVMRDTARLSQRYPPIAHYGVFGVSTWPIGCDTPSPFSERFPLESMRSGGAIPAPPKAWQQGYLSDTGAIPYENKANGCDTPLVAILSRKGIARYGEVSRIGPLWSLRTQNARTFPKSLRPGRRRSRC